MRDQFWILAFLVGLCSMNGAVAASDNFSGVWRGEGSFLNQSLASPIPVEVFLSLKVSATSLEIQDCWKTQTKKNCYESAYELNEAGQILKAGVKVGDLYPDHIVIFSANSQASEQMIFGWSRTNGLKYQYVFSAFDGASHIRNAGALKKD